MLSSKFGMHFYVNLGLCTALLHKHFHLRFEHIGWTRASFSFILSSPPPPGSDGHMVGTLPGFSNNRRDLISIPTSCHQRLSGYFVLARLKMWFEFAIRAELNMKPFFFFNQWNLNQLIKHDINHCMYL